MRTLLSSILILGLSAQPILAQRILSAGETAHAIRMGEKVCAIELKTGASLDVVLPKEVENIPSHIKRESVMLDEYFEVLKTAYLNCIAKYLIQEIETSDNE